jgi:hypothetical protein
VESFLLDIEDTFLQTSISKWSSQFNFTSILAGFPPEKYWRGQNPGAEFFAKLINTYIILIILHKEFQLSENRGNFKHYTTK